MVMLFVIGCGSSDTTTSTSDTSDVSDTSEVNTTLDDTNISGFIEPYYSQQWALDINSNFYSRNAINTDAHIHPNGLYSTYTGNGIKVAIIDDGLDVSHEDLVGAISATYDLATQSTNVAQTYSTAYHGTAVTGIVGARANNIGVRGVACKSRILFLKYKPSMTDTETIELFDKAAAFGADIISNSWGTGNVSPAVKAKIVDLANNGRGGKGISIVFACGNGDPVFHIGEDMGNDESAIPEVISVGATNKYNERTIYSNYGANLDIMAPGGESLGITTLDPMGSNGGASIDEDYLLYNDSNGFVGTSAATPIVSGVVALMLEKNPNLTRAEIENILKSSADKIGTVGYDADGRNDYYGYGKINLSSIFSSFI
jgi:subtilisin family serine protease